MPSTIYRNLRQLDGAAIDLHCRDGKFASIARAGLTVPSDTAEVIECGGQLLLPALVEGHTHLDKTLWGMKWRPNTAGPTRRDRIDNELGILRELDVPIPTRTGSLVEHCVAHGSLHIRSHVHIDPEFGLRHVEGMLAVREAYRDVVDIQFVAFPQTGMLIRPGTVEMMERALQMGIETVGGLDPAGIDNDPVAHLKTIFDLAAKYGRGIDIHLHDLGELGLWQIERLAEFTAVSGLQNKVTISHAYCLGMFPEMRIEGIGRKLADLGISLVTCAPANISVPPLEFLQGLGVNVFCGSDGIRDAWSPFGNGDMLERAFLLALRYNWAKDDQFANALACATHAGARALGLQDYGIAPGNPANFIYLPAENIGEALANRPIERHVVSGGRLVAAGGKFLSPRQG